MKQSKITLLLAVASLIVNLLACNSKEQGLNQPTSQKNKAKSSVTSALNAKTEYATTNGRQIAYRSIGEGEPIILCQRFRGNLDDWDPAFIDALAAKGYRIIIFDYSGFASSTGNPPENGLRFAEDVRDLATSLGYQKIIVGGWSIGGCVAQIFTAQFPEMVKQTILIGTKPPGAIDHQVEDIFLKTAFKPYNDLEDEIILFFEPTSEISRKAAAESHNRIASRKTDNDKRVAEALWKHYIKLSEEFTQDPYGTRDKMMKTRIPILVISPDHEVCFPPENWFALNRKLPTTQITVIPQAGHGPHHQYPEMVANYIHTFITHNKENGFAQ